MKLHSHIFITFLTFETVQFHSSKEKEFHQKIIELVNDSARLIMIIIQWLQTVGIEIIKWESGFEKFYGKLYAAVRGPVSLTQECFTMRGTVALCLLIEMMQPERVNWWKIPDEK